MKPHGVNEETGEPEYEEWEDGKPRAFFRCAIEGQQDENSEAMIQHMETHCFLPGDEARTLAGILFQAAGSLNALAGFLSEEQVKELRDIAAEAEKEVIL